MWELLTTAAKAATAQTTAAVAKRITRSPPTGSPRVSATPGHSMRHHGELADLDAHVPFVRAALFNDGSRQPRPPLAVAAFLLRARVADLDRALIRKLALVGSCCMTWLHFWSRAGNLCGYRLHGGLSSHTHQVCGALLVVDKETLTCALNLRSHHPALI
jgi:hypothetical protein